MKIEPVTRDRNKKGKTMSLLSRRAITSIAAVVTAAGMLTAPLAASAATHSGQQTHGNSNVRPVAVFEYGTSVTHNGITHGSITVVSTFLLPGAHLPATPSSATSAVFSPMNRTQNCVDDSTYMFQSCLTQNYNSCTANNLDYVNILSYVERWTRIDPSSGGYQLKAPAGMRAGADGNTNTGACGGKGGVYIGVSTEKVIGSPAPSTNYTLVPSWTGAYINTASGRGFYQCGNAYVQIYWVIHPSRTWTFLQPDVCQGIVGLPGG